MSWAPEAITDCSQWAGNRLRFDTKEEAETYLAAFSSVRNTRVVESYDPVNYGSLRSRLVARREESQKEGVQREATECSFRRPCRNDSTTGSRPNQRYR